MNYKKVEDNCQNNIYKNENSSSQNFRQYRNVQPLGLKTTQMKITVQNISNNENTFRTLKYK